MKKKKVIALVSALAMTIGLLAGCSGGGGNDGGTSGADEGTAAEDTAGDDAGGDTSGGDAQAVTIWYYWETEGHQVALDQVIQDYNGSQDKYEVTAKYVPFADFKKIGRAHV